MVLTPGKIAPAGGGNQFVLRPAGEGGGHVAGKGRGGLHLYAADGGDLDRIVDAALAFVDRRKIGVGNAEALQFLPAVDLAGRHLLRLGHRFVHARIGGGHVGIGRDKLLHALKLRHGRCLGPDIDRRLQRQHAAGVAGRDCRNGEPAGHHRKRFRLACGGEKDGANFAGHWRNPVDEPDSDQVLPFA